jgi:hypothetical protein
MASHFGRSAEHIAKGETAQPNTQPYPQKFQQLLLSPCFSLLFMPDWDAALRRPPFPAL